MGCDIHFYVEKRVDGKWVTADTWEKDEDDSAPRVPYEKSYYHNRNYDLFAILADVRNGRGFAGCETGGGFKPICDPKGLPDDACPEVKAISEQWDGDGHSHSWHTLADLLAYDWTQTAKLCGIVDAATYYEWNRWGREQGEGPKSYCGGVSGPGITHVSEDELKERIREIEASCMSGPGSSGILNREKLAEEIHKIANVYCKVWWELPYYKTAGNFWSSVIPRLLRLGKPEDVRIVFFFDN